VSDRYTVSEFETVTVSLALLLTPRAALFVNCILLSNTRYCSRSCQEAHWQQHKPTCQHLAQLGEGVAGANATGRSKCN